MFLKLTDNDTNTDIYLNPEHIVRFVPDSTDVGTLIYMTSDAGLAEAGQPQIIFVHESAEEIFRMISRSEKGAQKSGGGSRGLI